MNDLVRAGLYCALLGAARDHWISVVPVDAEIEDGGVRISGLLLVADPDWTWHPSEAALPRSA